MNIDAKHGDRLPKLQQLLRYDEFGCAKPPEKLKHLGPPLQDLPRSDMERDTEATVSYKLRRNVVDAHLPLLLFESKSVPNQVFCVGVLEVGIIPRRDDKNFLIFWFSGFRIF